MCRHLWDQARGRRVGRAPLPCLAGGWGRAILDRESAQADPVVPDRDDGNGGLAAHLVGDAPPEPAPEAPSALYSHDDAVGPLLAGDPDDLLRRLPDRDQGAKAVRLGWQQGRQLPCGLRAQVAVDDLLGPRREDEVFHRVDVGGGGFREPVHRVSAERRALDHVQQEQFAAPRLGIRHRPRERGPRTCRKIGRDQDARHHHSSRLRHPPCQRACLAGFRRVEGYISI